MPQPGEKFNPYRMFTGIFIPDAILHLKISWGAKICYGVLARFAGKRGYAFPKQSTLGDRLDLKERQTREYLQELELAKLIVIEKGPPGSPSRYWFLWHPSFEQDFNIIETADSDNSDRRDGAGLDRQDFVSDRRNSVTKLQKTAGLIGRESGRESLEENTPLTPPPGGAPPSTLKSQPKTRRSRDARRREEILTGLEKCV